MPGPDELFTRMDTAWSVRSTDPGDVLFGECVALGAPGPRAPRGVGLFGVPFDGAVIGRKGAREGPHAIRGQLARLKAWSDGGGDVPPHLRDWGDVRLPRGGVLDAHEATLVAARAVIAAGDLPFALGGDHSLTFPLVKAHQGPERRRVGVINLDAHLDVRDVLGAPNSGTSFGRLLADGFVPGSNLVEVGLREFANSPRYVEKARKAGALLVMADEWRRDSLGVVDRAIARASDGTDGVYLSIDIDVLDQAHAPGVSAPTPDGVDTALLLEAVRRIVERAPLVGLDLVEVAPPLDRDAMTSRAAAYTVAHAVAALARRG